jgi:hypothetical protein
MRRRGVMITMTSMASTPVAAYIPNFCPAYTAARRMCAMIPPETETASTLPLIAPDFPTA